VKISGDASRSGSTSGSSRSPKRPSAVALVLALSATLCAAAVASPNRPTLPVKAPPNSVASFRCPPKPVATLDIEACQGHRLLALGRRFNALTAILRPILDASGRRVFARAHVAWLRYRTAECAADARAYLGGTVAGIVVGSCDLTVTTARIKEVEAMIGDSCNGRARTGPYRNCP
jgi:uncharacterized protein YecT (DUF1311 family)